jgi:hypothetical protein
MPRRRRAIHARGQFFKGDIDCRQSTLKQWKQKGPPKRALAAG